MLLGTRSALALPFVLAFSPACGVDEVERVPPPSSGGTSGASGGSGGASGGASGAVGTAAAGASSAGSAGSASGGGAGSAGASGGGAGSAGSAGATGSAGSSGTGGAGANDSCAPRAGLLFCEDFEDFVEGPVTAVAPWSTDVNGDGLVAIDSSANHSGNRALKVTGTGFATFLVFQDSVVLPPPGGRFYVRTFVRLVEPMSGGHNTFIVADRAEAPGTGNAVRLGEMNAMLMYTVSGDTHGALANDNYYTDQLPGAALANGSYSCLELLLDTNAPEIAVWLDGVAIPDLRHTDWPLDAYDALRFGFEKYAGPVREIWYDDIAIGTEPIGCE